MRVTVNGQTIDVPDGSSVSVVNGVVSINGIDTNLDARGVDKLVIEGAAGNIQADVASVTVRGNVVGNIAAGGSVSCNDVHGSIAAGGSVNCDDVGGSVRAGGSISCDDIYNGRLQ